MGRIRRLKGKTVIPKLSVIKVVTVKPSYLESELNTLSMDGYEIFNIDFQSPSGFTKDDRVVIIAYRAHHVAFDTLEEE
jgi:hypothetical protein